MDRLCTSPTTSPYLLGYADIDQLMEPSTNFGEPPVPLLFHRKRQLKAILAFFHEVPYQAKGLVNIANLEGTEFNEFRINIYQPGEKLIPWKAP